jgi:dTDP-4-amino-4,6-dideoxygalactose transaminase
MRSRLHSSARGSLGRRARPLLSDAPPPNQTNPSALKLLAFSAHPAQLHRRLGGLPGLRVLEPPPQIGHAYYKYTLFVRAERLRPGWSRDRLMAEIVARGVPCRSGGCPEIYREKAFRGRRDRATSAAAGGEAAGRDSLMLLVHPTLDDAAMHHIADVVSEVVAAASL